MIHQLYLPLGQVVDGVIERLTALLDTANGRRMRANSLVFDRRFCTGPSFFCILLGGVPVLALAPNVGLKRF